MKSDTLRDRLRIGSSPAHARLDDAVADLDVATVEGLTRFLAMNAAAFRAMARSDAVGERADARMIADLAGAAEADLSALGVAAPFVDFARAVRPEAVDYVVLGSRIGTGVLRKVWAGSSDARVARADRYFSLPFAAQSWRALCADLAKRPADGAEADALLADVEAIFSLFETALSLKPMEAADA